MRKLILSFLLIGLIASATFAGTIKGMVTSASDDSPLIGANVYLQNTTIGAATDEDGIFYIQNVNDGTYTIVCDFVGYAAQQYEIVVTGDVEQNFQMVEFLFSKTINVIADRAKDRETPVAYTNVGKAKIVEELGSQDIPMVLNTTPSVYATMGGGGAGDARINVRGFNQRNVAIMINGVPVNDMENGWVYWSNWDGVGDASSSIQMQRGLSAVNLATPSIGGTMNILTDPTAATMGAQLKQEYGEGTFLKTTFLANTGLIDGKYAVNAAVVRKTGEGIIDKTWTDAWAYYFGAAYNVNKDNRLELYVLGAPQRHGQNLYAQNIGAYSHSFAKDLDDYDPAALDKFAEAGSGRLYNENWNTVSSSYKGKQAVGSDRFSRHDSGFLNERENFYHKPQVNINWYSNISKEVSLANVLYYSGGTGGGTGTLNNNTASGSSAFIWDYSGPSRIADWDATIAMNQGTVDRKGGAKIAGESLAILRNSRNDQNALGLISKLNWVVNDNLKTTFGIDLRTAEIDHYREVRDLLGGNYIQRYDSDFWGSAGKKLKLGDKIAYNFTNNVNWIGAFAQAEYTLDQWTMYGTFGVSQIEYEYTNHFRIDGFSKYSIKADPETGFQLKGGAMYRISDNLEIYGNAGYVEKVPIFDAVINDQDGTLVDNEGNEKFISVEMGANTRLFDGMLAVKGNVYYTDWQNRTTTQSDFELDGSEGIIVVTGMDARHYGFELETAFQPISMLRFDAAVSIGDWLNTNDANGLFKNYDTQESVSSKIYSKDLKTGDAPQTQLALSGTLFPIQGMSLQGVFRYYDNYYANWNPQDRIDPLDRTQSWKIPNYNLIDFHASYLLPFDLNGVTFRISAHIFNVLDDEYISDALDNSDFNAFDDDHDADDAEVNMGIPRNFNIGVTINY